MEPIVENILKERYYQPGETCWEDIVERVVNHIYPDDCNDKEIFRQLMISKKFLPNSPTLMNSGNEIGQLSACFCLAINDDMTSIFDTLKRAALIFKSGGGVGINFSYLRPKGAKIGSTNGTSTGVMGFVEVFNTMVETVKSSGMRRGAAIAILNDSHPDLEEFIEYKNTEGKLSNFNISVMVTDKFMNAVERNESWDLKFDDKLYKTVDARELYNKIADSMWTRAEPGVLFYDTINKDNILASVYGPIDSCNPCGEKMLVTDHKTGGGSSCNLGSFNLSAYVNDNKTFNFDKFTSDVKTAVKILDTIIDINKYPIPEIEKITKDVRELGLGVMGYHDMLIKMGMIYGSQEALDFTNDLFTQMSNAAYEESIRLGENLGAFPAYHNLYGEIRPRRNAFLLSCAPTGCQKSDTIILTDNGLLKLSEIGDIYGSIWQPISDLMVSQENSYKQSGRFFINGESDTKIITLYSGIELESTLNHKYRCLTLDNEYVWKKANDIIIGDRIVSRIGGYEKITEPELEPIYRENNHSHIVKIPDEMSPKLAEFIGILIGNGSFHDKGIRLHFNYDHVEKHDYVISMIKELFGIDVKKYHEHTCTSIYLSNMQIKRWLLANGLCKTSSKTASIPELIRRSSKDSLLAFVKGLAFADGSHTGGSVYIDTSSKTLSQELLICMRMLGINGRIQTYTNVRGRLGKDPSYRIYYNQYGSISYPEEKIRYAPLSMRNNHIDAKKVCDTLYCEEVIDIRDGHTYTYDIEVPENNCYVANGVISHNTLSLFANCSSGIEPNFAYVYNRSTWVDGKKKTYTMLHPLLEEALKNNPIKDFIVQKLSSGESIYNLDDMYRFDGIDYFVTSKDISWKDHIKTQSTIQKLIDSSISKTINCQNSTTKEEISELINYAWKSGCKGLTIYREGSRDDVVLETNASKQSNSSTVEITNPVEYKLVTAKNGRILPKTPRELPAMQFKRHTGCGKMIISIGEMNGKPHSITIINKGGCDASTQAMAELIALTFRYQIPLWDITKILCNIKCQVAMKNSLSDGNSCAAIIGKIIRDFYPCEDEPSKVEVIKVSDNQVDIVKIDNERLIDTIKQVSSVKGKIACPKCGKGLIKQEGCVTCPSCGYSKC